MLLAVWWFAVIDPNGEAIFPTYHDKKTCEVMVQVYRRVPSLKVTDCVWKDVERYPATERAAH